MRLARVHDALDPGDGARVLVDRLWPRGIRRDDPRTGTWMPEVAPSHELRRWYGHAGERFEEFAARYREELSAPQSQQALAHLRRLLAAGEVTLVTATREIEGSHAVVLAEVLAHPVRLRAGAEPRPPRNRPTSRTEQR
ncbi:DUF488 family protein [Ruania suaedae]|uniref:DUF488 domain-containing protein n=1 Tax=Ruania suaedae TaxID=2897774 RepID=UPI001E5A3DCB|nr:DUF488 family protein [Ruania suaedae]UFU01797.1 DUF488 family protein [Ruania suaedae]